MELVYIYTLRDPETNLVRYVGKANNPKQRLRLHVCTRKTFHSSLWVQSLKAKGLRPIMEIIEHHPIEPAIIWQDAERFYINYLRFIGCALTNHVEGGFGSYRMTDQSKQKCSAAKKGKRFTDDHRAKLSKNHWLNNGGKFSAETIEKIRIKSIGRKLSTEARAKIWEGRRREAAKRALTSQR